MDGPRTLLIDFHTTQKIKEIFIRFENKIWLVLIYLLLLTPFLELKIENFIEKNK